MIPDLDRSWTLFLDRDGVINTEIRKDYVKRWEDFHFEPGSLQALAKLSILFGKIIVVTNQRGVGAGLMTQSDLDHIHELMVAEIERHGGRIDAIFSATDEDRNSPNRKPNPTMGIRAKSMFPEIDFGKSVIVGNSRSDMEFGHALGMKNVYIDEKKAGILPDNMIHFVFPGLAHFASKL